MQVARKQRRKGRTMCFSYAGRLNDKIFKTLDTMWMFGDSRIGTKDQRTTELITKTLKKPRGGEKHWVQIHRVP